MYVEVQKYGADLRSSNATATSTVSLITLLWPQGSTQNLPFHSLYGLALFLLPFWCILAKYFSKSLFIHSLRVMEPILLISNNFTFLSDCLVFDMATSDNIYYRPTIPNFMEIGPVMTAVTCSRQMNRRFAIATAEFLISFIQTHLKKITWIPYKLIPAWSVLPQDSFFPTLIPHQACRGRWVVHRVPIETNMKEHACEILS
jgi:hypothetical protein